MQLKKGQLVEVDIEKLAFGGAGIGKCRIPEALLREEPSCAAANGLVTFVPNTVPGDKVLAALTKIKSNRLEGRIHELLVPSELRVVPKCPHFETCGGCVWQHLPYEEQLKFKEGQVRETLIHLGGFTDEEVTRVMRPIIGCAEPWNYRNKMEFSFGKSSEGEVMLGLHPPRMRHDVFDLDTCHLAGSMVGEIVPKIRSFAIETGLTVYEDRAEDGLLRNLVVREGKNTGHVMVNLVTSVNSFPELDRFKALFEGDERITSLVWTTVMQSRGVPTWRESRTLSGQDVIYEELRLETGQILRFEVSPESFFQPNTKQAEVLYGQVIELANLDGDETVFDLYCGTGTIGLFCAHKAKKVVGIEISKSAIENARSNALRNKIENAEFFVGDVSKVTRDQKLPTPDVIIVDPPRAGLEGDFPQQVVEFGAKKIVYVSCNPSTLTRDLKYFTENGYHLEVVQPVDMFPHTYHIENVALLTLTSS